MLMQMQLLYLPLCFAVVLMAHPSWMPLAPTVDEVNVTAVDAVDISGDLSPSDGYNVEYDIGSGPPMYVKC